MARSSKLAVCERRLAVLPTSGSSATVGAVIFLPIVERELRVTARKRSTSWLRVLAALIALVLGGAFLVMSSVTGTSPVNFGRALFSSLTWLSLATALGAGLFLTSDALSEEKRD